MKKKEIFKIMKIAIIGAFFSTMVLSSCLAQFGAAFGVKGGLTVSSFNNASGSVSANTTGMGGLFVNLQLAPVFTIQPELVLTKKGAIQTNNNIKNDIRITYFEVPILVKIRMPFDNVFFPHIFAGPNFAYNVNSKLVVTDNNTGLYLPTNSDDIRKSDVGGILGAGIDIQSKSIFFTIDGRYGFGFNKLGSNSVYLDVKNRAWTFTVGLGIRIGE
jgi:hypothetical protein